MTEAELKDAFEGAAREGEKFFSDATVYLERYLPDPRHVEVQVLADKSRQRRPPVRARLLGPAPPPEADRGEPRPRPSTPSCASRSARSAPTPPRRSATARAGTIEGLLPGRRVLLPGDEHPRAGRALRDRDGHRHRHRARADQDRRRRGRWPSPRRTSQLRGHAIECRINAEDAAKNFAPAPGQITHYVRAVGPGRARGLRRREGYEVLPLYDPMIAKLIVWDVDREASTRRMLRALQRVRDRAA